MQQIKKVYHHPKMMIKTFIICMWHGDLMSQPYNYFGFRKNGIVKAMVSENRDGEIITNLVSKLLVLVLLEVLALKVVLK